MNTLNESKKKSCHVVKDVILPFIALYRLQKHSKIKGDYLILKPRRADVFRLNCPSSFICLFFDGMEIKDLCAVMIVIAEDQNISCGRLREDQSRVGNVFLFFS